MTEAGRSALGADANPVLERWIAVLRHLPAGALLGRVSDGKIVYANDLALAILGAEAVDREGVPSFSPRRAFHTDGRLYGEKEWPLARAIALGERVTGEEIDLTRADGGRVRVGVSANPIYDERGERVGAVAMLTALQRPNRSESAFRFLADARELLFASKGFAVTVDAIVRLAVPKLGDCCAVDVVDGHTLRRVALRHVQSQSSTNGSVGAPKDGAATADSVVERVLASGSTVVIGEHTNGPMATEPERRRVLHALGARAVMIVPLMVRGRTLGGLLLGSTNPEHRFEPEDRALAEELAALAALAMDNARLSDDSQAAQRAKADFLSVVSHELRTPLTAVIGYSELLALGIPEPVTDRQAEQIGRIEVSARQLMQLIEEILTVVSLDAGTIRICEQPVRLADIVERAGALALPLASEKHLSLTVSMTERDLVVRADPDRLLQVINCLLSNAVKFTEEGSIELSVAETTDSIQIVVRDSGIGLGEAERARIFDAFWQVERPITRRVGGTGLGLAICRKLLDLMDGDIDVTSQPGVGSTFTVRIPHRS